MIKYLTMLLASVILYGCSTTRMINPTTGTLEALTTATTSGACSPMLSWLGGVCILGGMALLVISRGTMGWRPLIGGIVFLLINYAIALYANWFFLPVAICTGALSLAWTGKIVWKIVNDDKIKLKELKL
tara:strand:- start:118 stop:507 length:390 start_codon:yes stop_codon:yes gene_type:complete